jgi:thioredoxin-like negative regulator of GroEL
VKLAKIDVMENPEVFEHYSIEALPQIYFYTNDIAIEYYGT